MSYLSSLRFHFAGRFQAAPSTVNNDPNHYNNAAFQPSWQKQAAGAVDGWFNPAGDAVWRLVGCKVTGAWMGNSPVPASDPIYTYLVADSDRTVAGKLIDLDPEQQLVSQIWGLQVRLSTAARANLFRGSFRAAAFNDIWNRAPGGDDFIAGAAYQSVLEDVEWGDVRSSEFLIRLRDAIKSTGKLSIKFNVDGYSMDFTSPEFTFGRMVGTIGPFSEGEPDHFVLGRHFVAIDASPGNGFFHPQGEINFCPAVIDAEAGKIYLDLGNAMPTVVSRGAITQLGTLTLGFAAAQSGSVGTVAYQDPQWYENTAGVVEVPDNRQLTATELQLISSNPLTLTLTDDHGQVLGGINEPLDGIYLRPDQFVYRLNPGETAHVRIFATRYGQRYARARIVAILDPSQLQFFDGMGPAGIVAVPEGAIDFPARVTTDEDGMAELRIVASDPGNPRQFIEGQVYGVRPIAEETLAYGSGDSYNPWDFVSLLVFDAFKPDDPPTWYGSLQPIFQQYANLYPVMKAFLDLADYDSVCANRRLLLLAFGLPPEDPNSMPVTRDLSGGKRAAILRWLSEPGEDGKLRRGKAPSAATAAALPARAAAQPPPGPLRGGKAVAMSRRLFTKKRSPSSVLK